MWIWIAAVVFALIVLAFAVVPLLGRLAGLQRAAVKLRRRQAEAMKLQEGAAVLEQTLLGVQQRADTLQERLAAISPGADRK
jgi:flagellar biosynthesis/type III secretory pathway M-ring protein FliF/YscJ